jgi:hypothetical protein
MRVIQPPLASGRDGFGVRKNWQRCHGGQLVRALHIRRGELRPMRSCRRYCCGCAIVRVPVVVAALHAIDAIAAVIATHKSRAQHGISAHHHFKSAVDVAGLERRPAPLRHWGGIG